MTYRKKAVFGLVLFLLTVFVVYSCIMVFGARSREPERAKLVIGRTYYITPNQQTGGKI